MTSVGLLKATRSSNVPAITSPKSLTGLHWWIRADGVTGLNHGDPVDLVTDEQNGFDMTSGGVLRPTFETGVRNGLPGLLYGMNGALANSADQAQFELTAGFSAYIAFQRNETAITPERGIMMKNRDTTSPNGWRWYTAMNDGAQVALGRDGASALTWLIQPDWGVFDTIAHIWALHYKPGDLEMSQDRVRQKSASGVAHPASGEIFVVGNMQSADTWFNTLQGHLLEAFICTPPLPIIERFQARQYLGDKWAIA